MHIQFLGAALEVTGSCHLISVGPHKILLDCGMIQGLAADEERNFADFPFNPRDIDAVVLSHAHIDHSGRLPRLVKQGFRGPIYTHRASRDLCRLMLEDAAYIAEKDSEWENRKRERKGLRKVGPLYTVLDAERAQDQFVGLDYDRVEEILPGVKIRLRDAGHILGSSVVELWLDDGKRQRKLVFSGDLGHNGDLMLRTPELVEEADLVLMESTYGDRDHRPWEETSEEIRQVVQAVREGQGNILIPSFSVGRTQGLLYLMARHYKEWGLERWHVFLDSPLGIKATGVYAKYVDLYNQEARAYWQDHDLCDPLPNIHFTSTPEESMSINRLRSGAIIIAGSGMCNGGRIKHHLKHNVWRENTHIIIVGFQAQGTIGRRLVEGASHIRLWGETIKVNAKVHTVGGLSAHAGQSELVEWYGGFSNRPPVVLVHGEPEALDALSARLRNELQAHVHIAQPREILDLGRMEYLGRGSA